ncbi:MAG: C39 family peptidase [Tatlockia sp.]|nr:C39 family peptidase [Tatlockia sp.]
MKNQYLRWLLLFAFIFSYPVFGLDFETHKDRYPEEIARFYGLQSAKNLKMLKIRGYQQTVDYSCAPAAVMSLLHYYGKLSKEDMNHTTELKIAKEMGTSIKYGTSEQQLLNWLNTHGFEAQLGYNGRLSMLENNLNKGVITLVDWFDWGGHWVIVAGYNKAGLTSEQNKDTLFFADSAVSTDNVNYIHGLSTVNPERFKYMWFNSQLVKGIYISVKPRQ